METQNNSCVILVVAAVVVSLVAGFFLDPYLPASMSNAKKGYTTGFDAARQIVEGSRYGDYFRTPSDIRYVSGTVTAINGDRLTISAQEQNLFDGLVESEKTVIIDANTSVYKFEPKDPKVYQEELATFLKSLASKVAGVVAPLPTTKIAIDLSSITIGTLIAAIALENIKDMKEFTASEIQIQHKLEFSK